MGRPPVRPGRGLRGRARLLSTRDLGRARPAPGGDRRYDWVAVRCRGARTAKRPWEGVHMPRKTSVLIICLLACAALTATVHAQDSNADCRNLDDPVFAGWTSYAQLGTALDRIERTS